MRSKVFNTTFENMLRLLLLVDTLNVPANVDRLAALDFICIYGKKCKVFSHRMLVPTLLEQKSYAGVSLIAQTKAYCNI